MRYSIFPETVLGSMTENRNNRMPAAAVRRPDICFSSVIPRTTSFTGRRLVRCMGSHADKREALTATANEKITLKGVMTAGISMPCERERLMPCRMHFRTSIPVGMPSSPPDTSVQAAFQHENACEGFFCCPMLRKVPIMGSRSRVITL